MPVVRRLLPPLPPAAPAPLLWRDETPPEIRRSHDGALASPGVDLLAVAGLRYGGLGLLARGERLAVEPGFLPLHATPASPQGRRVVIGDDWVGGLRRPGLEELACETPVLAPVSARWIYGHFLVDILPRALLLDAVSPPGWPVAVADAAPAWLPTLLGLAIPRRRLLRYDPERQAVVAPAILGSTDLCTPDFARPELRGWIDLLKMRLLARPLLKVSDLVPRAKGRAPAPDPAPEAELLWVSRRSTRSPIHHILNEEEIEDRLAARGWRILRPEAEPFEAQVRAFDAARVVCGEYGSGLHNAIFSRPGTTVVGLNRLNGYQSRLAEAFGHRLGFVAPDGGFRDDRALFENGEVAMRFDPGALVERLRPLEQGEPPGHDLP